MNIPGSTDHRPALRGKGASFSCSPGRECALFLLFLLFGFTSAAFAQTLTSSPQVLPGLWSGSASFADYDSDGDPDLLLTGLTGPADGCAPIARIYRNSNGAFTDIGAGLTGIYLGGAAWGDYDGDGDLDVALSGLTAEGEGTAKVYRNDGGSFAEDLTQNLVPLRYSALAWGDYDGDGDLDLAVSGMSAGGSARTILYRNTRIDRSRIGSPLGGRPILEEDEPNTQRLINLSGGSLAWGDVDNDGDLDLALSGFGTGGTRQALVYLNRPAGTLIQDERTADLTPVSGGSLAWGDYDNDGDLDLALSGWNADWEATLNLYTNAAGILRENTTFSSTRTVGSLAWGDYDNDGDLDLAAAGQTSTSDRFAFVLRNGPPGRFQEDRTLALTGLRGGDLAFADYDEDGDLDLLLSGENGSGLRQTRIYTNGGVSVVNTPPAPPDRLGTPIVTSGGVTLNWNDGTDPQSNASALTYTLRIGTSPGDHNVFSGAAPTGPGNVGNSKTVQLAIPLARDTYYWSVRAVDGSFLASEESQEELFRVQDLVSSRQNLRPLQNSAMAWADYDNDGDLDLVLAGRDADGIARSLLYRNDAGTLVENSDVALAGVQDGDLAWADYDNDGDLDLALTGADAAGNRNTHLYRNRLESGDFALNVSNLQNLPQLANSSVAWGDYDNDGDLDLALMGTGVGKRIAGIYRNDGGTFVEDTAQPLTPMDNGSLAWGDYDNDGDLDLTATGQINDASDDAHILYQNGPVGALTPDPRSSLTGLLVSSLAWGDYDNDGDLDLAISGLDFAGRQLVTRVYANDGTGLLSDAGIPLTGAAASDLAWGDYDNDGDLDLALVGQATSGGILQIYRNQAGSFEGVSIDVLVGIDFAAVSWADYDNDGDLDLASSGRNNPEPTTSLSRTNDNLESRFNPNHNPSRPAGLAATTQTDRATLAWAGSTDLGITPDNALTYALRVGTEPGGSQILSGVRAPGPGPVRGTTYRLQNLESGRYFWAVRALDSGLASSGFSSEESFIVDTVKPIVNSVRVRPPVLLEGRRATVVVNFQDAPAGMDNAVSPRVTLQLAGGGSLPVGQISFSGDLWIGEADIQTPTPGGTVVVDVQNARDLKGNQMLPHQAVIPALIAAGTGGVVESGDGVVSLVVSPRTLPATLTENPDIEILTRTVGAPPSGTTPVGAAYDIQATPAFQLQKAATLIFDFGSTGANPSGLAVYRLDGASWTRIGGTIETGTNLLKAPIDQFGAFALFQETAPSAGTPGVTNIDFTNRAFAPGAEALRPQPPPGARPRPPRPASNPLLVTTDISFDLGAQATVRIEIYDRSGSLRRILEPGRTMGPGRQVITWDGRDADSRVVRSGLYIVVIDADGAKGHKTVAVVNN